MSFEELKQSFPAEGHLCKRMCGKCCVGGTPVSQPEMEELLEWVCKNKTVEQLTEQFHHYDEHGHEGDACPFLTPEKKCFVYPARPVACHAFGHLEDLPADMNLPERAVKQMSQKCPEGVEFTEVKLNDIRSMAKEWLQISARSFCRIRVVRHAETVREDGTEGILPRKDGSQPPVIEKEHGL